MFADGAAFNPATGGWRKIAQAPLAGRSGHIAVWTGQEMVVWGGYKQCCPIDSVAHDSDAAAYNPTTDSWRRLVDVPSPWSGDDGGVIVGAYESNMLVWRARGLGLFDVAANTWRDLGAPPSHESNCSVTAGPVSIGTMAGSRFYVWTGGCSPRDGAVYDARTGKWSELGEGPVGLMAVAAAGRRVFAMVRGDAASTLVEFDPTTRSWKPATFIPERVGTWPELVWTGSEFIAWDGYERNGSDHTRNAAAYTPARSG
jgi:hypothetical protein